MNRTVDLISSLPDDVLSHILLFVSTKEAVQTCILSKRWRNTWTIVPVLKFQLDEFLVYASDGKIGNKYWIDRFVNGVLENRGQSCLDTVIYGGDFKHRSRGLSMEWLNRVAFLMPRVISVCIRGVGWLNFPDSVFSCASLENLELSLFCKGITNIRPKSIALPSLKTLKLRFLSLDDDFAKKLFLGCPSLESLNLESCDLSISDISSNVLKDLTFDECWQFQHMRICCPSLVSLSIESYMNSTRIISLEKMDSVVNACISLHRSDKLEDVNDLPDAKLFSGLSNATSLKLHIGCHPNLKKQWEKDIPKCRTFKNLKSLEISAWDMINDFDLVACFLKHSPVLQQLTLVMWLDEIKDDTHEEPRQDVLFQFEYLELVNIYCQMNDKLSSKLISMLGRHVKTVGNINIFYLD
jgi:hypothetical protein